ncbi:serine hydrolase domain-containing protein [Winogradskyella sp.]|uniref:serine hydrolase domain-containing protein n=1 Tax=Winogradskyella sp. TaxID=1883156 RepID=UPI0025E77341|nr:serine hydrolase domain-containing protein [Winogradskyella sp.]MBT8245323.1 beta-lactamase family protein [Winogradskyella sp.]
MIRVICPFILFSLSIVFLSCNKESKLNQIETYEGEKISFEIFDEFLKTQMDSLGIPALSIAIINEGKIVYNSALGVSNTITNQPVSQNSIFESASLSKPIFAFFVMKLSEKGIIDLDRPLHFYLPDEEMEKDQRYKNVSARMVLSHRTGFPNWRWFDKRPENLDLNRGDFFMIDDPGTTFTYSGEAYQYLARVIAHLNFMNMYELNELFQNEVAKPLRMEHAYFVWDDYIYDNKVFGHLDGKPRKMNWGTALPNQNSKIFSAAGGLRTEAKSYAQFMTSIINGQGLDHETYKEMLSPYTEIPKDNVNYTEDGITDWSLGFGIKPMKNDTIYRHGGSNRDFQSEFAFSINKKYGYVFFVNCDKGNELNKKLEKFLEMRKK